MPTTTSHVLLLCVYVGKNFAKFKPITIVIAPTMLGGNNLLIKLADHFKVSVDFLLCLDEIDSEVISLALKIMQLNEADKKRILNYIDIALYKE